MCIVVTHKCSEDVTGKQRHSKYCYSVGRGELSQLELVKLTTQLISYSPNFTSVIDRTGNIHGSELFTIFVVPAQLQKYQLQTCLLL